MQYATYSMNKTSFMMRKVNIQVSRRENSTCNKLQAQDSAHNKFHEHSTARKKFLNKIGFTRRKINAEVSR